MKTHREKSAHKKQANETIIRNENNTIRAREEENIRRWQMKDKEKETKNK